jgi:hypothetical protein
MRAFVKSLLAELFPGWVKEEVIQNRPLSDSRRRVMAAQKAPPEGSSSFGKRSSYPAGTSGQRKGGKASGPGTRA